jgi:hypothetical protein
MGAAQNHRFVKVELVGVNQPALPLIHRVFVLADPAIARQHLDHF